MKILSFVMATALTLISGTSFALDTVCYSVDGDYDPGPFIRVIYISLDEPSWQTATVQVGEDTFTMPCVKPKDPTNGEGILVCSIGSVVSGELYRIFRIHSSGDMSYIRAFRRGYSPEMYRCQIK